MKTKTDDKIRKISASFPLVDAQAEQMKPGDTKSIEDDISDDELTHDRIKVKQKKHRDINNTNEDFFEDVTASNNNNNTFYEMNLSRPLMKAVADMKFIHPTPIQASTIPLALLGMFLTSVVYIIV